MNFNMGGWPLEMLELQVREAMAMVRQEVADHGMMWTVTVEMLALWQEEHERECALARWADDGGA